MAKSKTGLQEINKKIELIDTKIYEERYGLDLKNNILLALLGIAIVMLIGLFNVKEIATKRILFVGFIPFFIAILYMVLISVWSEKKVGELLQKKRELIGEKYR